MEFYLLNEKWKCCLSCTYLFITVRKHVAFYHNVMLSRASSGASETSVPGQCGIRHIERVLIAVKDVRTMTGFRNLVQLLSNNIHFIIFSFLLAIVCAIVFPFVSCQLMKKSSEIVGQHYRLQRMKVH